MDGLTCATFPLLSADVLQDATVFNRKEVVNSHLISVAEVTEVLSLGPPAGIIVTTLFVAWCTLLNKNTFAKQMEPYVHAHSYEESHWTKLYNIRIAARDRN